MTPEPELNEDELEALFEAGRETTPPPSEALLARIEADGLRAQSQPSPLPPRRAPSRAWLAALGGWPALAGLSAAAVAGVWIGVADPYGALSTTVYGNDYALPGMAPGIADVLAEG